MELRPIPEKNNFDFLRFALASLVIVSHSYQMLPGQIEPLVRVTQSWSLGDLAVSGFFIISGMLVTHSWVRSHTAGDYARKRALRIYPGFVAAMLLCGLVVLPLASGGRAWINTADEAAAHAVRTALLQRYEDPEAFVDAKAHAIPFVINGSTWTIFYELLCYLLTPALVGLGLLRRRGRLVAALAALIVLHAGTCQLDAFWRWRGVFSFDPVQAIRFFTYYTAGVCFYAFRDRIPLRSGLALLAAALLGGAARWGVAMAAVMPLALTYLVFWFAFAPSIRLHNFARRGDFSYGIYIYGSPIQQLLIMWTAGAIGVGWLMGLSMAGSLAAGVLSWHLVEKHFLRLKGAVKPQAPDAEPLPAPPSLRG